MRLPVSVKGVRNEVECDFASQFDQSFVDQWKRTLNQEKSPPQEDAIEFLESAASKWAFYDERKRVVRSTEEIQRRTKDQPDGEFLGILTAVAPWSADGELLGFCQFRRTWSNNIAFDFLATNPQLLVGPPRPISGVGTALLYRLAMVAHALKAKMVWAETSSLSVRFYARLFEVSELSDLLVLDATLFYQRLHQTVIES